MTVQATYYGEDFTVAYSGRAVRCDYGVQGSPVWDEIEDIEIASFEFLGHEVPIANIPAPVLAHLIELADECEDWE